MLCPAFQLKKAVCCLALVLLAWSGQAQDYDFFISRLGWKLTSKATACT